MTIQQSRQVREFDAVIVGAGFAGLYMLHKLRMMGLKAHVLEAGHGPGGTWYWNRYPGARCDIDSLQYSYQFDKDLQLEWDWKEKYAAQAQILEYVDHVVDRFDLRPDIQFDTRVRSAHYDEATSRWTVDTSKGEIYTAEFCIMATGCLSSANMPHFKHKDAFKGPIYHTGQWPHEGIDFTGKRVAVIGTGSSAIQTIPIVAKQARHLTVFQRTPAFTIPAQNRPLTREEKEEVKAHYDEYRQRAKGQPFAWDVEANEKPATEMTPDQIRAECERRWEMGGLYWYGSFADMLINKQTNDVVSEFVRGKIREMVRDPEVAALLTPKSVFGCKRICADTGYYETYNRDNVRLVDVSIHPIEEFTPNGIRVNGREHVVDAIISATGFDAMTGSLNRIEIRGRDGEKLTDKWEAGPRTYLGVQSAGFPNLFMISGPGSPSVLTCMITSIEQHVEFIGNAIAYLRARGLSAIEPNVSAEDDWVAHVNEVAAGTLLNSCNSWYLGANVPGKPRVFMPYIGFPAYVAKCEHVVKNGYEGFVMNAVQKAA